MYTYMYIYISTHIQTYMYIYIYMYTFISAEFKKGQRVYLLAYVCAVTADWLQVYPVASVLQLCCSVLQCFAVCCSRVAAVLPLVAVCCNACTSKRMCVQWLLIGSRYILLQLCCSVLQFVAAVLQLCCSFFYCVAVCCSVCSVLQCATTCCSAYVCAATADWLQVIQLQLCGSCVAAVLQLCFDV